jgi:predicted DNA-binding transcriptional regulator AlpA
MLSTFVDDAFTTTLADKICERLTGIRFDAQEAELRLRLALEQRVSGASTISFGLDRLSTTDAASYLGLQAETLRATVKRKALELPTPYMYGKKLYWRRSELDAWVKGSGGSRALNHPQG